ncbi:MAG TPA: non-heme iron oxygenase ferredoxin subunit [Casimicrobiaceae bacterium]|nr:non-heme iron oxygenase ferredoxin subunit [Casimicrobiaceae bacterium]
MTKTTDSVTECRWVAVAKLGEPIPRHGLPVEIEGHCIALFDLSGRLCATSNICTHQLAYMTDGYVDGEYIECPMHQGRFHIPTGAPQCPPVTEPLPVYPVRMEGEAILVGLPGASDP